MAHLASDGRPPNRCARSFLRLTLEQFQGGLVQVFLQVRLGRKSGQRTQVGTGASWGLTPELSRTAARNGGVVHVTMQPSREAVSA